MIKDRLDAKQENLDKDPFDSTTFITEYELNLNTKEENIIALTYFAFTTLSTVGLGDYHPKCSSERIFCSLILIFGVTITSFLMESLS